MYFLLQFAVSYAKLINGQGLAKLMNDTNLQVVGINTIEAGEIKKPTRTGGGICQGAITSPHGTRIYLI